MVVLLASKEVTLSMLLISPNIVSLLFLLHNKKRKMERLYLAQEMISNSSLSQATKEE
jgi:hypothetical protein